MSTVERIVFNLIIVGQWYFVFVEEEIVLLGLTPVNYVLLQLLLIQLQLFILESVVFLLIFVFLKNLL